MSDDRTWTEVVSHASIHTEASCDLEIPSGNYGRSELNSQLIKASLHVVKQLKSRFTGPSTMCKTKRKSCIKVLTATCTTWVLNIRDPNEWSRVVFCQNFAIEAQDTQSLRYFCGRFFLRRCDIWINALKGQPRPSSQTKPDSKKYTQ